MEALGDVALFDVSRGYDLIRQQNGLPTTHVTATVDKTVNNSNRIISQLQQHNTAKIMQQYDVTLRYEGKAQEQQETFSDMRMGLVLALIMIYLILAGVFSSYSWPVIIMLTIPVSLTGGILGHFLLGIDFTILSLFGFLVLPVL